MGCISFNNINIDQLSQSESTRDYYLLKQPKEVEKILFQQSTYLWIAQDIEAPQNIEILRLLRLRNIFPSFYNQINDAKQMINNKSLHKTYRIISSDLMKQKICKAFQYNFKISHIYLFCEQELQGNQLKLKYEKIRFYATDTIKFVQQLQHEPKSDGKYLLLPNFMEITNSLNDQDNSKINRSRYNLYGLMNFKDRHKAKQDFITLIKTLFPSVQSKSQIQEFELTYPQNIDYVKTLNWYTKQTFFYRLLNNFLRSSNDQSETAYIRLPFQATFKSIKYLYDKQKQSKCFQVYRKGIIDQNQIDYLQKNVGQYIEVYGFMSTSLNYEVTQRFHGNMILTIVIQNQVRESQIDYGYVRVNNYSEFANEQEILFNALNVYKILDFGLENNLYKITLKYGELARIVKQNDTIISEKQRRIIINYKHQQEIIKNNIKDQADIFKYCQMFQKEIQLRFTEYQKFYQNEQNATAAEKLHKLAEVYRIKAQFDKALQYFQKSLQIKLKVFGEQNVSTANTLNNIGLIYAHKNQLSKCLQFYERSLKIKINKFGQNDSSTADTIGNMSLIFSRQGKYDKAIEYLQRAVKIKTNLFGENHIGTADLLGNLGIINIQKRDFNKSLQYQERALQIKLNLLGQNHSGSAMTINNIGQLYHQMYEYDKSLQYFFRALKIKQSIFGEKHYSTALTLNNIGQLYFHKQEFHKALQYLQRALAIKQEIYGENHGSTILAITEIGQVLIEMGQLQKAAQYCQKSLELRMKLFGQNHKMTAVSLFDIGKLLYKKQDYTKALEYFQKSLKIKINIVGENHIIITYNLDQIGLIYIKIKQFKSANQYFQRSLNIKISKLGQSDPAVATTLINIGKLQLAQQLYEKAFEHLNKSYPIYLKAFGKQSNRVKQLQKLIQNCQIQLRNKKQLQKQPS